MESSTLSITEIKLYCINKVNTLKKDQRDEVLQFLVVINKEEAQIHQQPDGCRINLDKLPESALRTLYGLIKYKLEN
jgi:hypothetical protein